MRQTILRTVTLPPAGSPVTRLVPHTEHAQRVVAQVIDRGAAVDLAVSVGEISTARAAPPAYSFFLLSRAGAVSFDMPADAELFGVSSNPKEAARITLTLSDAGFEAAC